MIQRDLLACLACRDVWQDQAAREGQLDVSDLVVEAVDSLVDSQLGSQVRYSAGLGSCLVDSQAGKEGASCV